MPVRPPPFRPNGWKPAASKRPESHDPFYGTKAWRLIREQVLLRDGFMCSSPDCTTPMRGAGTSLIADHIIERTAKGTDDLSNLRTLCADCHGRRHPEKGARSYG